MSRRVHRYPSYRLHRQSGQAIVTLPDGFGGRKDFLLGPHGSPASEQEYRRRIAEWEAAGRCLVPPCTTKAGTDITICELTAAFWKHAKEHYRRLDGTPTNEINEVRQSLKPLLRLYGATPARDFGPLALEAVRNAMVNGSWLTDEEKEQRRKAGKRVDWCRSVINKRVERIRRLFRWAVEKELIPADKLEALRALRGLQRGRTNARESKRVKPVAAAWVEAALPFMSSQVQDMVLLQLHSGAQPVDTSVSAWTQEMANQNRLHDTIKSLNKGLKRLRFGADGTGEAVRWHSPAAS